MTKVQDQIGDTFTEHKNSTFYSLEAWYWPQGSFSLKISETKLLSEKFQHNFWNALINGMEVYKWTVK